MISNFKEFFEQFGVDPLQMKVGKPINVSEANIGVLGYNEKTGKDEYTKVEYLVKNKKQSKVVIMFNSDDDYNLECAKKHKLAIYKNPETGKLRYALAKDLKPGMSVYTKEGYKEIADIKKVPADYVYDIQTELHNFYSDGVLSHNSLTSHAIVVTGGRALKFYASTRNRVTKVETIEDGAETIGIRIKVRNYKNKTGVMFREREMVLYFDKGFDSNAEYIDFFISLNIITGTGWYTYTKDGEEIFKLQGRAKVQAWLDEHPDVFQEMKAKVNELLKKETDELDGNKEIPKEAREDAAEEASFAEELAKEALAVASEGKEDTPPDIDLDK